MIKSLNGNLIANLKASLAEIIKKPQDAQLYITQCILWHRHTSGKRTLKKQFEFHINLNI